MPVYDHANENPGDAASDAAVSSGNQHSSVVSETLAHNAEILASDIKPAVEDDKIARKEYDGRRVIAQSIILYVDQTTGRIAGIGSHEKLAREGQMKRTSGTGSLESDATGIPQAVLDDPNTVRINAWFEQAVDSIDAGELLEIQRPESWPRNDRVRLSARSLEHAPLEQLIPEAIERGILLKSIEDYNQTPEPKLVTP